MLPNIFNVNVRQGKGLPASQAIVAPSMAEKDIRYIKTATSFNTKSTPFPKTGLFYGLLIFPFLLLGGAFVYKQILAKNGNIDLVLLKRKRDWLNISLRMYVSLRYHDYEFANITPKCNFIAFIIKIFVLNYLLEFEMPNSTSMCDLSRTSVHQLFRNFFLI